MWSKGPNPNWIEKFGKSNHFYSKKVVACIDLYVLSSSQYEAIQACVCTYELFFCYVNKPTPKGYGEWNSEGHTLLQHHNVHGHIY